MKRRSPMDEIDQTIIQILKEDARKAYTDIAKKVGLSEGAVRKRVQDLVKSGVIRRFTISMGVKEGVRAITLISAASTPEISAKIMKLEGVEAVYEITGQYDIAVLLSAANIEEINQSVDKIRGIEGITNTNTMIILRSLM
jgi:Lrp/AsnC family leucine-responsive transcriptional regulator